MATLSPIQQHHHHHHHLSSSTPANVGSFGDQQQSQQELKQETGMAEGQATTVSECGGGGGGEEDGKSLESNSKKSSTGGGGGFLKTSLLSRARNSTINLASLATVTNKFTCSASVGNLWHGHHHHHPNANEGVEPIEYVTSSAFDSFHPDEHQNQQQQHHQHQNPVREVIKSIKSASSHKLQGSSSTGRKLSTKDKSKRHKEAERVEKLRLLVSYLKSGTSQPVVSPVALEADEIELAERYKLHMALRDDLLRQQGDGDDNNIEQQSASRNEANKNKLDTTDKSSRLISHSIGGTTTTTSPASSSSSSMNQHHHHQQEAAANRTIQATPPPPPHIGNVTWVLRHSISDPGNAYEQSSPFTALPLSSAVSSHHNSSPNSGTAVAKLPVTTFDCSVAGGAVCDSCAPSSSSYSGSSINNYCMNSNNRFNLSIKSSNQIPNNQIATTTTMPKLFYIDDPNDLAPFPASACSSSTPNANVNVAAAATATSQHINSSPISHSNNHHLSTSFCSQPATPAISTTSGGECLRNNSSSSGHSSSGWTNPHQNLATWIDNEVNSLVHDLEATSQQKGESKGSGKSGSKKKWLSVTSSSNPRRNSSGAQST